jgi:small nuclear ribonucleoprotein (snRNP)-like protein
MAQAMERMLANNLADFEGLKVEGKIVVSEALINIILNDFINIAEKEPEVNETIISPPVNTSAFDIRKLLQSLYIDRANIHLEEGKMIIDLKISK